MPALTSEQKKLQKKIQENFHVDNSIAFAKKYPTLTYEQLSQLLTVNVAPIQLIWLLADEAFQLDEVDWFVKDALVREMQSECPNGWHYAQHANFETAGAIASWISTVGYLGEKVVDVSNIARQNLKSLALTGWLPVSINDPVIDTAFEGLSFSLKTTIAGG